MNYTVVVYGGPMFLVTLWWFVSARTWFKGPKVNVEHLMLGRDGNVVEGVAGEGEEGNEGASGASVDKVLVEGEGKG